MAPRPDAIKKALQFAKETGNDVYVPYYPLCTDYPLTKAYEMIHETYKMILADYKAENISVLGTSSGGNLALGMIPYINDGHNDTPVPGHIITISPGTCVETDEEWQRMCELDKKDDLVVKLKEWVDKQYEEGRVTVLTDNELENEINVICEEYGMPLFI